ncbi:MAG: inositol monophosphatase family protein [Thermodesulfobacteriota bacterium]|nr:inositol monophosphatase family protein [Thermodesulfobacteriota bacterium]
MERLEKCIQHCGNSPLAPMLKTAGKAALQAGRLLASLYTRPHEIRFKGEIDLVTEADPAAEKMIMKILGKKHPEVEILAEESRSVYNDIPQKAMWIIDPLDGTTNFAHGFPWFAVSIAYMEKGKSLAGVIYAPMLDELFCACHGQGAWLNGRKIEVSATGKLTRSLLATGFPYDVRQRPEKIMAALEKVLTRSQGVRRAGAAALDLAYVACGRLEGFWEIKLKPWDTAAGILLVKEAGGMVTDFQGGFYSPFVPEIISSNGHVHGELVGLLKEFGESS